MFWCAGTYRCVRLRERLDLLCGREDEAAVDFGVDQRWVVTDLVASEPVSGDVQLTGSVEVLEGCGVPPGDVREGSNASVDHWAHMARISGRDLRRRGRVERQESPTQVAHREQVSAYQ
jgi:hypothetical protein